MKKSLAIVLGVSLLLASAMLFVVQDFNERPPILTGNSQSEFNYVAFFGFALGGAGALILLFAFLQWLSEWGPKHGLWVKSANRKR